MVHALAAGVDTIKYRATNSCGTSKSVYVVSVTASKQSTNENIAVTAFAALKVYPNPSNGLLTIEADQNQPISTILVSDISGKVMQQLQGAGSTLQVDISNYASGIYLIKVLHEDGQISQVKVMKQ